MLNALCALLLFYALILVMITAGEGVCCLEDILIFCTGADCIPPLGFNKKIDIIFLGPQEYLPTSSTCFLNLRIPTCFDDADVFNDKMETGLKGGQTSFAFV